MWEHGESMSFWQLLLWKDLDSNVYKVFMWSNMQDKDSGKRSPEDKLYVSHFAMNVFMKADKQDRAGRADLYVRQQNLN